MDGAFSSKLLSAPEAGGGVLHTNGEDNSVHLPSGEDFLRADFARSGPDLLIETPSGGHYVLPGYFMAEDMPSLETFDGAVLSPKLVSALAGPQAVGMVAQAAAPGDAAGSGASIGQVSEVAGGVTVRHVDGSQGTLAVGAPIFQGDVLETGAASHVGIIFVDDTVFSLDEGGRMVIDEMVFDPGAQTGVFNAQVVQGVFSFVSGQVAKTSPDGMVVSTPTSTIGIRGSTVLGEAAAEGAQNRITLAPDVDGNVGELTISNGAGTQVLNQAGASTTIFSAFQPPAPPVIMSPTQIQQNFGTTLTKLTQVVAQKATVDAARAQAKAQQAEEEAQQAESEAQQAQDEAQQADEGAQAADAEAEAAQAEAEAAQAAAEAAKAEAEAKGDPESLAQAQAAEAKAAEAQAKAQVAGEKAQTEAAKAVEVKASAEAKMADFVAKTAEVFQAQAQVQKAVEFTAVAKTAAEVQGKVFQEFVQSGLITLPPGMSVADVMSAGQQYGAQMAAQAGLAGTVGPGDGPGFGPGEGPDGGPGFGPEGRPDFGPDGGPGFGPDGGPGFGPEGGFQGPGPQYGFQQQPFGMTGFDPFMGGMFGDPFGGGFADPFGGGMFGDPFGGGMMDPYGGGFMGPYGGGFMDPYGTGSLDLFNFFDPNDLYNVFATYDPFDVVNYYYDDTSTTPITTVFGETLVAGNAGGTLSGSSLNSNFYFQWRDSVNSRYVSGDYTVTDAGGTDQLSLDNLDDVVVKVAVDAVTYTSGVVGMRQGFNASDSDATLATVTYSGVDQFMLSDVSVAAFATVNFTTAQDRAGDVMILPTLSAGETGYVIAGTSAANTISIYQPCNGALIFGKGGGDTFNFTVTTAESVTAIGGITATDNQDLSGSDGIPDTNVNVADYTGIASYDGTSGEGTQGLWVSLSDDITVTDLFTAQSTRLFEHQLWDMGSFTASLGNDQLTAYYGNYNTINGAAGNDTITVNYGTKFLSLLGGDGNDTITANASVLTNATAIDGGAGTDGLTLNTYIGGTFSFSNDVITNFETVSFDASSAGSGVTVTDTATGNVTFTGSSSADIITGGSGVDTITGGSGADIFKYTSTTDGGGTGDLIQDFTLSEGDKFNFLSSVFTFNGANVPGALDSANFISGAGLTAAVSSTQYFIYDSTDSVLYYDADGLNGAAAVAIANVTIDDGISFSNAGIVMV